MAAVTVNVTVIDGKGKSSISKVRLPTGFSIAQYSEAAPLNLSAATIRAAALDFADIAKKALFTVRSSVSGLFARFNIPTYAEANTVTGSDEINTADPDIAAFVAILEDGVNVSGTFIQPCDLRENDLAEVTQAREIFRKYN
jgi:hypothetical protein